MNMDISPRLRKILMMSFNDARQSHHEYVTAEHLLKNALLFDQVRDLLSETGADIGAVGEVLEQYLTYKVPRAADAVDPAETKGFQDVINRAVCHCAESDKEMLDINDVLVSMLDENNSYCSYSLKVGGVSRLRLLEAIGAEQRAMDKGEEAAAEQSAMAQADKQAKKNSALARYCTELVAEARAGRLDNVIGREEETERMVQVLCRRTKNNPILVGEAGVGKTAVCEGLALRVSRGNVPDMLSDCAIYALDVGLLVAGTKYRGDFEERVRRITEEVSNQGKYAVLFIDEIHTIMGAGSASGALDAASLLKPALSQGRLHCIGSTTYDEYSRIFEKDAALSRRFQKIDIKEPTPAQTLLILKGLKARYEQFHSVVYSAASLQEAVNLSVRYLPNRRLPDKAIDIIDEAGSYIKTRATARTVNKVKREAGGQRGMAGGQREMAGSTRAGDAVSGGEAQKEMDANSAIGAPTMVRDATDGGCPPTNTAVLDRLQTAGDGKLVKHSGEDSGNQGQERSEEAQVMPRLQVTSSVVRAVTERMAGVSVDSAAGSERGKLRQLQEMLQKNVFGQDDAVAAVTKAVKRARAGFRDGEKPEASFLFVGPTGVGKTELSRTLARALDEPLLRYDMSEYQEEYTVSRLIGAAPGYIGYDEGGRLTEDVRRNPHAVVLFDEMEKAHEKIQNVLLQVMDYGFLTDSRGRKADFRDCIIIMTSNAGAREMDKGMIGFGNEDDASAASSLIAAVNNTFSPEFRGRLNAVVTFRHLSEETARSVAKKEIDLLAARLSAKRITLTATEEALALLANKGYSREGGARNMAHTVEDEVATPLTDEVLFGRLASGGTVRVCVKDEKISFEYE